MNEATWDLWKQILWTFSCCSRTHLSPGRSLARTRRCIGCEDPEEAKRVQKRTAGQGCESGSPPPRLQDRTSAERTTGRGRGGRRTSGRGGWRKKARRAGFGMRKSCGSPPPPLSCDHIPPRWTLTPLRHREPVKGGPTRIHQDPDGDAEPQTYWTGRQTPCWSWRCLRSRRRPPPRRLAPAFPWRGTVAGRGFPLRYFPGCAVRCGTPPWQLPVWPDARPHDASVALKRHKTFEWN